MELGLYLGLYLYHFALVGDDLFWTQRVWIMAPCLDIYRPDLVDLILVVLFFPANFKLALKPLSLP